MFRFFRILLTLIITLLMLSQAAYPVAAHGGGASGDLWHHWAWQDLPLLLLMGAAYARGLGSLWQRAGTGSGIGRGQAAAFGAGLIVLFIALVSPLDALSEQLLSAHMIQHLLMVLVAAPLFAVGRFPLALAWAVPPGWTSTIWKQWGWGKAWNALTRPMTAFLLHNAAIWIWHMPRLYEASVRSEPVHFLEHFSFFFTAFLFWQVFADLTENIRIGRSAAFGLGIFMVFGTMLIGGFLGVLIAFSPQIWYGVYAHETVRYGLTALEDQQLAGTIMWVPSGVVYLAAVLRVMGRWLFAMEALENPGA
jgi:putative membrane protein